MTNGIATNIVFFLEVKDGLILSNVFLCILYIYRFIRAPDGLPLGRRSMSIIHIDLGSLSLTSILGVIPQSIPKHSLGKTLQKTRK